MDANVIPSDAPSVFDVLGALSSLERQAIVRPNNPPPGIAGFLFDVIGDDAIELTADITDHFVEGNTAINDQIALLPERVIVRGLVAELVDGRSMQDRLAPTPDALPEVPAFVPELAPQAQQQVDDHNNVEMAEASAITSAQSLYSYFNAQSAQRPNQSKQAKAFLYFYNLFTGRQLFSVETPWGIMNNVAILSLRAEQDETTRTVSEFRLTFKKIRFANELAIDLGQLAGRAALQAAPVTQNGNAGQTPQTSTQRQSWLYRMANPSP